MGHRFAKTPHIDALVTSGTVMKIAHLPMSRCRPTLASMLSGRYPHQNHVYYNRGTRSLSPNDSLPILLRDSGYATFASGKFWEGDPKAMGFTHGKGNTHTRFVRVHQNDAFRFIDEVGHKQPFFMWWAPKLPHEPHNAPKEFMDLYDPKEIPIPLWVRGTGTRYRRKEHRLLASTSWLDRGVGDLMEHLRKNNLIDNTIIVFLIDNGWCVGLPSKGTAFEKGLRTPIIMSWPGKIPAGRSTDELVSTLDLFPTLLEYVGVKSPKGLPGKSLTPLIQGTSESGRETLSGAIFPGISTIEDEQPERDAYAIYSRDKRWKYIHYLKDVSEGPNDDYIRLLSLMAEFPSRKQHDEDLFDLQADPYEQRNLAEVPEHKAHLQRLRATAEKWWTESGGKPFRSKPVVNDTKSNEAKKLASEANNRFAKTKKKLAARKPPNIVYILADDLGYGDIGCFGQRKISTPNIDQLATEGMRLTQHYAGSSDGSASRCTLMTGLHTGHSFIRGNPKWPFDQQGALPQNTLTLGSLLQSTGYQTAAIGKWGLGRSNSSGVPTKQGFDMFYGFLDPRHAESHYPAFLWRNNKKEVLLGNAKAKKEEYAPDLLADSAISFIDGADDTKPFFLYLALTAPHAPLQVPKDSLEQYRGRWQEERYKGDRYAWQNAPRATYAAMISRLDRDVGRVMAKLKEKGLDENTVVVFSSDNGPNADGGCDRDFFNSTGNLKGMKGTLFEGGIRIPMIARWPGQIAAGSESDHISAFWDILPTLAQLAGLPEPDGLDGKSLVPTLVGLKDEQEQHEYLYWELDGHRQAMRFGDWKLIRNNPDPQVSLYHLSTDPKELNDLGNKRHEITRRMKSIMVNARNDSTIFKFEAPGPAAKPNGYDDPYLTRTNLIPRNKWTLVSASSESSLPAMGGAQAFDDDSTTFWFTGGGRDRKGHPHQLIVDMQKSMSVTGIRYLARQYGKRNGHVRDFELYLSDDPKNFGTPILKGALKWESTEQEIRFEAAQGRYVLLRTLNAHNDSSQAAIAEFGLIGLTR
ncbi:MAG: arylsulfatase A [Planctomycetota bacterium]|jgi:arylsulfatase A